MEGNRLSKKIYRVVAICTLVIIIVTMGLGCDRPVKITTGLKDTVIFKLSDRECGLAETLLILVNEKNQYENDFGKEIWEKSIDETTMEDRVKDIVKERQIYLEAMYIMALEEGIELSDDERESLNKAAETYFDTLTDKEKELLGVTKEDIYSLYTKSLMSERLYDTITQTLRYEVSDEEARVMRILYIYISKDSEVSGEKINEAYGKVVSGTDFYSVAAEYTEDETIQLDIGRGQMLEEVEEKVFVLQPSETTDVIDTESGYYIVKCVDDYLEDSTNTNKKNILAEKKNQMFLDVFEPFLQNQRLDFNNNIWSGIRLDEYEEVDTENVYEIYQNR